MVITKTEVLQIRNNPPYFRSIGSSLFLNYVHKTYFIDAYFGHVVGYRRLIQKQVRDEIRFAEAFEELTTRIFGVEW